MGQGCLSRRTHMVTRRAHCDLGMPYPLHAGFVSIPVKKKRNPIRSHERWLVERAHEYPGIQQQRGMKDVGIWAGEGYGRGILSYHAAAVPSSHHRRRVHLRVRVGHVFKVECFRKVVPDGGDD